MVGRTPAVDEAEALSMLLNRVADDEGAGWVSPGEMRAWLTLPGGDPENVRVFELGGQAVAYADVYVHQAKRDTAWADVRVLPERRDGAVEEAVLAWAEGRARELRVERLWVDVGSTAGFDALLAGRGYGPIRHSFVMAITLADEPPAPHWPERVAVRPLRPGEEPRAHAAADEAFEDHWNHAPDPFDEWLHLLTGEGYDPTLWFLALDGDEVAAVCLCRTRVEAGASIGWCSVLGVRRPWRRQGLGLALLRHAFRELRARGLTEARLEVDGQSLTGAVRLYERAGMHVASRTDTWELPLR